MSEPDRITALSTVTSHVALGLARLVSQFRGKPVMAAILTSWLTQVQELEDALWDVLTDTALTTSVGAQLDQLGEIVGFARPAALSDANYRAALQAWILANRSKGTGEDILAVFDQVLGVVSFALTECFPAGVLVEPAAAVALPASVLVLFLRRAKAAGVLGQLIDVPSGDTFAFGSDPELPVVDAARGFSDTAGLVGGQLVGVLT